MDTATVVDLGRQALWITVLISAPLLGVALFVGLIIGILQAATSINEATLSFIPKLAALAITLAVGAHSTCAFALCSLWPSPGWSTPCTSGPLLTPSHRAAS